MPEGFGRLFCNYLPFLVENRDFAKGGDLIFHLRVIPHNHDCAPVGIKIFRRCRLHILEIHSINLVAKRLNEIVRQVVGVNSIES